MQHRNRKKRIYQRLLYERHLLRRLGQGLCGLSSFAICIFLAYREYPVSSFRLVRERLETEIINMSDAAIFLASANSSGSDTSFHKSIQAAGFLLVGCPFVYVGTKETIECPTDVDSGMMEALSTLQNQSNVNNTNSAFPRLCMSNNRFLSTASTHQVSDYIHGPISITVVGNMSQLNETSASLFVFQSVLTSPADSIVSVIEVRSEPITLPNNRKLHIRSFKRTINDNTYINICIAAITLSTIQLFIDIASFRESSDTHWTRMETVLLHRVIPFLISLYMVILLTCKYFVTVEKGQMILSTLGSLLYDLNELESNQFDDEATIALYERVMNTSHSLDIIRDATIFGLWLLLLRVVIYLSSHPRLAILTATLRKGFERLIYFFILYLSLLLGFATAYVGAIDHTLSLRHGILRLGGFILGNPELRNNSIPQIVFAVLFGVVMCITGLYWLLALAVSAYEEYLHDLGKIKHIVPPLLTDIRLLVTEFFIGRINRWPSRLQAMATLQGIEEPSNPKAFQTMISWYGQRFPGINHISASSEIKGMKDFIDCKIKGKFEQVRGARIRRELDRIDHSLKYIQRKCDLNS